MKRVDLHYDGVAKALLSRQGVKLPYINELTILQEWRRISMKEAQTRKNMKVKSPISLSPMRKNSVQDTSPDTKYVTRLDP